MPVCNLVSHALRVQVTEQTSNECVYGICINIKYISFIYVYRSVCYVQTYELKAKVKFLILFFV